MNEYLVTWVIDIEADSPEEAAEEALAIHRDPQSSATVFNVSQRHNNGRRGPVVVVDLDREFANVH